MGEGEHFQTVSTVGIPFAIRFSNSFPENAMQVEGELRWRMEARRRRRLYRRLQAAALAFFTLSALAYLT